MAADIRASVAKSSDIEEIKDLLWKTAHWLQQQGSTQWSALLNGNDVHGTENAVNNENVFIFRKRAALAGMVILFTEPSEWDHTLWEDADTASAIYLHRLAINRDFAGEQLGTKMMGWVETGILLKGKACIRLDCVANNPALNTFYQRQGYQLKGEKNGFHKYEKKLAKTHPLNLP